LNINWVNYTKQNNMKIKQLYKLLVLFSLSSITKNSFAQLGINSSNTPPATNAMLDVSSTTKGVLFPRMTTTQRNSLTAIATDGLTVYDTTTKGYWFFNGTSWQSIATIASSTPWITSANNIYNNNVGNVGIGITAPTEKLQVVGNVKATGLLLDGGNTYDYLIKSNVNGTVGRRKGFGAQAISYIIALQGIYPSRSRPNGADPFIGEIVMFAGNFAPAGWAFCDGRLLAITSNTALFSLLGTNYGGNGTTTFGLPDLRGAVPVGFGSNPAGYNWAIGQKEN
jgi:Phage Tail Collar Domain